MATTNVFIDTYHPKTDESCAVKIKVTHERERRYYPTGITMTEKKFNQVMFGMRLTNDEKGLKKEIQDFENKASAIIKNLPIFTWIAFEKKYQSNRAAKDTISDAITEYANYLRKQDQIGSAVSYECLKSSFDKFMPGACFVDVTPKVLQEYQQYMTGQGRSITTVGIYLRALRSIFNIAIENEDLNRCFYPFGSEKMGKDKYEIPSGNNVKKALSLQEIEAIYNYKAEPEHERSHAYWIFMYLGNGLNCADMCRLKYSDIKDGTIEFVRQKTKRTKKKAKPIEIIYTDDLKRIVNKFGNWKKDGYIFPVLEAGLSAERERQLIQQVVGLINDHMRAIAVTLKIKSNVNTMACRHSFSTRMQQAGVAISAISEALGHSSLATTQNYLGGFTTDAKKEHAKVLTAFR